MTALFESDSLPSAAQSVAWRVNSWSTSQRVR